jgi:sensor histidine kinase YesM
MESRLTNEALNIVNLTLARISSFLDNSQNLVFSITAGQNMVMSDKDNLIVEFIKNYATNNQLISETLYYINPENKVICNRQIYYDIMGNPMLETLAENAWSSFGSISWSQPYYSPISGTTIAIVYPIESKSMERLGVLVVEISLIGIREALDQQLVSGNRSYILMTSEGNIIALDRNNAYLPFSGNIGGERLLEGGTELLTSCREGISRVKLNENELIIVKSLRNRVGWTLYSIIDRKTFYTDLNSLAKIQISTSLVWIIILLFFSIFISRNFSTPIRDMVDSMASYKDPETASPIRIIRHDEIGTLAESYNQLLETIKNLIWEVRHKEQEKKEYELNMLQSQIQPHFLYNTLACIGSLAKQKRIGEVRNTISSLVNLLSFTFDKPAEIVDLPEEFEAIKMYVQIQKMRFGDIFDVSFQASDEAMTKKIPKLTLQPVIENAIINSILPSHKKDSMIRLKASVKGTNLIIIVEDNGLSLRGENIGDLENHNYNPRALDIFTHLGMINSNKRLRLYYGPQYGISLQDSENGKPAVVVVLPA